MKNFEIISYIFDVQRVVVVIVAVTVIVIAAAAAVVVVVVRPKVVNQGLARDV
jgi:hypothetical protein